jgi:hypothetical protein
LGARITVNLRSRSFLKASLPLPAHPIQSCNPAGHDAFDRAIYIAVKNRRPFHIGHSLYIHGKVLPFLEKQAAPGLVSSNPVMVLGHSRPDILLGFYAHVLDASADMAAATMSGQLGGGFSAPAGAQVTGLVRAYFAIGCLIGCHGKKLPELIAVSC